MKPFYLHSLSLPLLVAAGLGSSALAVSAAHIDFAIDGEFASSSNFGDVGEVSGDPANILGGIRAYETVNDAIDGAVTTSLAPGGPLSLVDGGDAQGRYWFGYGNESSAGDLNANFIGAANWNALTFTIDSVVGSGTLGVQLNSGPNSYAFTNLTVDTPGDYSFLYSETLAAIPAFDFTSVDGVNFEVNSLDINSSFTISGVVRDNVIPEPSSGMLACVAIVGLMACRRRKH